MRRLAWTLPVALLLLLALPALAGESVKCTLGTQDCLDKMATKLKNTGFVGIEYDKNEKTGILTVTNVIPGTPAEAAGLQKGDVLYALNGVVISDNNEEALKKARKEWQAGQQVTYTIRRDGADRQVSLTLGSMPADVMARWIGEHMMQHASVDPTKNDAVKK